MGEWTDLSQEAQYKQEQGSHWFRHERPGVAGWLFLYDAELLKIPFVAALVTENDALRKEQDHG